ncbi:DUF2889 domain-containing protein [Emcibacter nanhaiensis]|uniref:DUF2889 domain-containing protein n=1 Tax=Emcibacter nanhaiensis TaxID=1505037 RepID=A0A501PRI0_9PROT|nr:DUF2889 domain-containing protein [Emcibacter nanhaiensis]TPD62682.1 DUF2889 domain-containing protein [Emcibacter nanhaiensis]
MPLSSPAPRKHLHTRTITYTGYERDDGLWDIEGHMTDTKTYAFENQWRGEIQPGEPVHEMWVRLTLDDNYVIQDIEAVTDNSPFEMCPAIVSSYKRLIGVRIGAGWRKHIRERVGGVAGCTHITELLYPLGTAAMQTMTPGLMKKAEEAGEDLTRPRQRPPVLNTCHAWATTSPAVKQFLPDYYEGPKSEEGEE